MRRWKKKKSNEPIVTQVISLSFRLKSATGLKSKRDRSKALQNDEKTESWLFLRSLLGATHRFVVLLKVTLLVEAIDVPSLQSHSWATAWEALKTEFNISLKHNRNTNHLRLLIERGPKPLHTNINISDGEGSSVECLQYLRAAYCKTHHDEINAWCKAGRIE